jgi:hypothetical protein
LHINFPGVIDSRDHSELELRGRAFIMGTT